MTALSTLAEIEASRLIMVVRAPSADAARAAIAAARAGGVRVVEVTFTVPDAVSVIRELAGERELVVGAGTVLTLEQAEAAVTAGARFLVSPGLDEQIVRFAAERDVLMLPGVFTASEVMRARALGAVAVKLFPADAVGPAYLKALRGPFPGLAVMPSGGVSAANAAAWIAAGAVAVGMSGSLSPASDTPDSAAIAAEARRVLDALGLANDHSPEGQQ
jgi:2-dehydro-3-deoxyphosphogluconate aldolase/(4S)-4-hydroxy-2-oxoglutarate aldolase